MLERLVAWTLSAAVVALLACGPALSDDDKLKREELQQLLAPIALYPDELLTNVLIASTYPLDVVQAARWRGEKGNKKLAGDALTKALESKEWDPSIKALVQFPDVLQNMSDKLDWTQKLGDAFLAQQDEVMDEIQFLRKKADEAGNLKSNKQQKVVKEAGSGESPVYIIEPSTPETVYVPAYKPTVVYGDWWYPSYPPYAWSYPGASYVNGFWWGTGVAVAAGIWGWNNFNWHDHDIDIDVNKWNNINVDRDKLTNKKWEHRPERRGSVPYRDKDVREKFKQADRGPKGKDEFRGRDRAEVENRLKDTDRPRAENRPGDGADKIRDKAGDRSGDKIKDRAGDRPKPGDGDRKAASRDLDRAKAKKPSPGAFDVKRGSEVRKNADRGKASRVAMKPSARPSGGREFKGGGGGPRGGGGGRGGGGRRR